MMSLPDISASAEVARLGSKAGIGHLCLVDLSSGIAVFRDIGDESTIGEGNFWGFLKKPLKRRLRLCITYGWLLF